MQRCRRNLVGNETPRRGVRIIAEYRHLHEERTQQQARAEQQEKSGAYYEAGFEYLALGDRKKAEECAKRLRWKREFTYAIELYQKLGMRGTVADIQYEAGQYYRAAETYMLLYAETRSAAQPATAERLYERACECADRLGFIGNPREAGLVRERIERFRQEVDAQSVARESA